MRPGVAIIQVIYMYYIYAQHRQRMVDTRKSPVCTETWMRDFGAISAIPIKIIKGNAAQLRKEADRVS